MILFLLLRLISGLFISKHASLLPKKVYCKKCPSLGLSDHLPGCGILNYRPGRAWSLMVCIFEGCPGTLVTIDLSHFQWSVPTKNWLHY